MFKICPEGHGEFQQRVTHCPDCGAALQLATSTEPPAPAVAAELPPAHELTCIERGDPRALLEIAEHLQSAGVSCRIDAYPPDQPIRLGRRGSGVATTFGLYVRPAEAEEATRLRTQHLHQTLPESAGYQVATGTELHECPACGAPLAETARECEACGLEFPEAGSEP